MTPPAPQAKTSCTPPSSHGSTSTAAATNSAGSHLCAHLNLPMRRANSNLAPPH
ncbi:hypothetical protein EMPG_16524 [Blastomyces silverae]|uniref:Uncharacterized protein n=1 Tax=Blastomyces silverae TaxID=2060906 RepID=A0A0H1BA89_9EURO|nr:hypothetical protein EMPG_16524 [Blastomyces silverae]